MFGSAAFGNVEKGSAIAVVGPVRHIGNAMKLDIDDGLILPARPDGDPNGLRSRQKVDGGGHFAAARNSQQRPKVLSENVFGTMVKKAFERRVAEGDPV